MGHTYNISINSLKNSGEITPKKKTLNKRFNFQNRESLNSQQICVYTHLPITNDLLPVE